MYLRRNIIASYISQIYVALVGIVMVPMYVRYMGVEAYGLVGFFAMLQAWFQLLDMGLTPTMARETARFNGGAIDALSLRRLLRAMEGIFIGIAVLGAASMAAGSGAIAASWLKVEQLPLSEVQRAIILMAIIIALRWVCGLYRSAIGGFERLVWLSSFNVAMATARFALVIPFFIFVGASPTHFFGYQLALGVIEVLVLVKKTYGVMPKSTNAVSWQWSPISGVLKFSTQIAFASMVWILMTQIDKLLLSNLLSLTEFAYFTLAVLVASGVLVICSPISIALLPRMIKLVSEGDDKGLFDLYCKATQFTGAIVIPFGLVLALFSDQIIWIWTGDKELSRFSAPILTMYALGNIVLALAAFPYYLQFSKNNLSLHVLGNIIFLILFIPALICSTLKFGAIGAGYAWLGVNIMNVLFWAPRVHSRLGNGALNNWLASNILKPNAFCMAFIGFSAISFHYLDLSNSSRLLVFVMLLLIFSVAIFLSFAGVLKFKKMYMIVRRGF